MKPYKHIVSLFLAITIALISFYPCADRYVSSQITTELALTSHVEEQSTPHTVDVCSPFCACVCCAVSVNLTLPNYTVPTLVSNTTKEKTLLPYSFVETIVYHIWQPPKLV